MIFLIVWAIAHDDLRVRSYILEPIRYESLLVGKVILESIDRIPSFDSRLPTHANGCSSGISEHAVVNRSVFALPVENIASIRI